MMTPGILFNVQTVYGYIDMGINIFRSSSTYDRPRGRSRSLIGGSLSRPTWDDVAAAGVRGNPNPGNFRLLKFERVGKFVVTKIRYPDCTNYEGQKIIIFNGRFQGKLLTRKVIKNAKVLDPHFSGNKKHLTPVARFKPTEKGWRQAIAAAKAMSS